MTVAELIEELKRLPGDPDLRAVRLWVTVQRPYASAVTMECNVTTLGIERDVMAIRGYGYIE